MPNKIKLIVSLGNPDKKYLNTYHNVGFLFLDSLVLENPDITLKYELLKSEVFMNESGIFVEKILKKHGAKPEELLVVHDDSDLELGTYKLQFGRGAAGHHGVESVQQHLKTKNFWRLRIGVRPSPAEAPRAKAGEFVLRKITAKDKSTLEKVFSDASLELNQHAN